MTKLQLEREIDLVTKDIDKLLIQKADADILLREYHDCLVELVFKLREVEKVG